MIVALILTIVGLFSISYFVTDCFWKRDFKKMEREAIPECKCKVTPIR